MTCQEVAENDEGYWISYLVLAELVPCRQRGRRKETVKLAVLFLSSYVRG